MEEDAPNGGDGNQDGVPDALQANVTSLPNAVDQQYVTLVSDPVQPLAGVIATGNPSPGDAPAEFLFPLGFLDFQVNSVPPGQATTVTIIAPADASFDTYYKYGPTADNSSRHWYEFLYDEATDTGAEISGNILVLHFARHGIR